MTYERAVHMLDTNRKVWAVTGVAGFIGSHLLERLLKLGQTVQGLDNFSTGYQKNLDEVKRSVTSQEWGRFRFLEGDIREVGNCRHVCSGADYVLHQAALGSVPRSLVDPILTNLVNVSGFVNMLDASRRAGVKRFVYASSSSVYGDDQRLPKVEENVGSQLSPYAVSKFTNELYAKVFWKSYDFDAVGLRYFNVFGPRQDPNGDYAAVIPRWINAILEDRSVTINGDGETSRDFCFIENVLRANILAATADSVAAGRVYNVAVGARTSLNTLYKEIARLSASFVEAKTLKSPIYNDFRLGDVRHSEASILRAAEELGFVPACGLSEGLQLTLPWYVAARTGATVIGTQT